MSIGHGRVIPRDQLPTELMPVSAPSGRPGLRPAGSVVPRERLEALEQGEALIAEAQARAEQLLERARADAADVRLRAETEARADAAATLAARWLSLARAEAEQDERGLDRSVQLARVLAERLLGQELQAHPERIADLARTALREARGARQVVVHAHPDHVPVLESLLGELGYSADSRIQSDPNRPPGQLLLETDLGALDAALGPQLERLALQLRESLR